MIPDDPIISVATEKLAEEQMIGNRAKHAYDNFIKQFCEEKRLVLFENFAALPLSDEVNVMEVKRMLYAIDALDDEIKNIIQTGHMASISLNKEVKH